VRRQQCSASVGYGSQRRTRPLRRGVVRTLLPHRAEGPRARPTRSPHHHAGDCRYPRVNDGLCECQFCVLRFRQGRLLKPEPFMPLLTRAVIAILAGIDAGTICFGFSYKFVEQVLHDDPGVGYTPWLLTAIFAPMVIVPLLVFRATSLAAAPA